VCGTTVTVTDARVDIMWNGGGKAAEIVDCSRYVERSCQPDRLALVPGLCLCELIELCLEQVSDTQQQRWALFYWSLRPPDHISHNIRRSAAILTLNSFCSITYSDNLFAARLQLSEAELRGSCCRAVSSRAAGCLSRSCIVSKQLKIRP